MLKGQIDMICKCGKPFMVFDRTGRAPRGIFKIPVRIFGSKTCSRDCSKKYSWNKKSPKIEKECISIDCNNKFNAVQKKKYCSRECRIKHHNKPKTIK